MQIEIESTDSLTTLNGVPCRVWKGVTASGIECLAFVHRLAVSELDDQAGFERELQQELPPGHPAPLSVILTEHTKAALSQPITAESLARAGFALATDAGAPDRWRRLLLRESSTFDDHCHECWLQLLPPCPDEPGWIVELVNSEAPGSGDPHSIIVSIPRDALTMGDVHELVQTLQPRAQVPA